MFFRDERKEVAKFMRRLYKNNLTTASGGNVSMKNKEGYIFITASQTDKSCIKFNDIIVFAPDGKNLTPELKPSMEFNMHLEIYNKRNDVFAIVHSHPVYATCFSVTGNKIDSSLTGESRFILGDIVEIDYELMGTDKLAYACSHKLSVSNAAIMKNHGAITLGKTLFEAYDRMEVLEFTAKINFNILSAQFICNKLSDSEISIIDKLKNNEPSK